MEKVEIDVAGVMLDSIGQVIIQTGRHGVEPHCIFSFTLGD